MRRNEFRIGREESEWEGLHDLSFAPELMDIDDESKEQQERRRYAQDTQQRRYLAKWVVWTSSTWLGCVIIIIIMCGVKWFTLPISVLNTLLATTTVNVLGLAFIVLRSLFKQPKE